MPNSIPKQKVTKFLARINSHALFVREDRILNREIYRSLKRLACEEHVITQLRNGGRIDENQRRVSLLQEQVNQHRLTFNSLVEETRDLKFRLAKANNKQIELKKEKEYLVPQVDFIASQIKSLKSELHSKHISSQQKTEHVS